MSPSDEIVLEGIVVEGDRRGRLLGFPTANVELGPSYRLPADGVYAGWLERGDGSRHLAAISVGTRPTYYADRGVRLVEVHVLDFDGDLYEETVRVVVGERLRGQARFGSSEELIEQMRRDVAAIRSVRGCR